MPSHQHFAQQLKHRLKRANRVLLTMTTGIDGDSIGSMLAMAHLVQHLGREYVCHSPEPIPPMFNYLLGPHVIRREIDGTVHDYSVVVIFDTGDMKRSPLADELRVRDPQKTFVINIDHHPTVTKYKGEELVDLNFVDTSAGATTEILYKILTALNVPLSPHSADSLLTGILTDTGHFSNQGTTLESLDIAARLMSKGADHKRITAATMKNKSIGSLQLWGRALSRLKYNPKHDLVSTVITLQDLEECGVDQEAATGISNFLNSLGEGKIALVLTEMPGNKVKGSFRTTSEIDVAAIAKKFGGGGHKKAAGFTIDGKLVPKKNGWTVTSVTPPQSPEDLLH